jgi:methionine-rich copper-binding protein CopC
MSRPMFFRCSIGLSFFLGLFVIGTATPPAWAHAYPAVSVPNNGATLKQPPSEVRIQFTEAIEMAFSAVTVIGPNNEIVSQGKLRKLADDSVAIGLKPLQAGNYSVEWQVLSVDTHVTEGVLRFTIAPSGK